MDRQRKAAVASALLLVLSACSALAQTTKPAAALALPGSLVSRPFGTSMPGKTNVLIGCIGPFKTRPTAARAMEEGIKLAIADAAETLGPNVNLLLECVDTAGDKDLAAAAMKYLVGKKAVGVIGDFTSGVTLGAVPVANEGMVPLISPSASSPALTKASDYFFRTVPNDLRQAAAAADLVTAPGGAKSVAIVTDGSVYGTSLTDAFAAALKAKGGKVAATVKLASAAGSKAAVAEVAASKADAVFFAMNDVAAAAAFIRDAAALKLKLYAGDSIMDPDLFKALGANAATLVGGMRGTGFTLGAPAFRTRFTTASKIVDPPPVAAHSFDAATLLLRAYAAAAPPKGGAQVGAALPRTRFPGAVGAIALDATGDQTPSKATYSVYKFGPTGALVPV